MGGGGGGGGGGCDHTSAWKRSCLDYKLNNRTVTAACFFMVECYTDPCLVKVCYAQNCQNEVSYFA